MNKSLILIASIALSVAFSGLCRAQSDAPYTEGPVWTITMVKAKAGMGDEYLKGLAKTFKGAMDEAKKQDLIMDYKILLGPPATPQDFDILLMVESKNMAALDKDRKSTRLNSSHVSISYAVFCLKKKKKKIKTQIIKYLKK